MLAAGSKLDVGPPMGADVLAGVLAEEFAAPATPVDGAADNVGGVAPVGVTHIGPVPLMVIRARRP
jgi:hypothetical protein